MLVIVGTVFKNMSAPRNENMGYEFVCSVSADGDIPITKYKSESSGMSVFIAQVPGPLVHGYFCLATEAHDDDGLPHTLEHLIFLGSEDYPYKGVLDLLANRCLASGTNAWTDTDHTCYTLMNAGSEGFLNLLPIYLDHILYPTLSESGYITEVHHVNGEGDDAGVVYCEMQARENSGESRCYLEMLRAMYPGHCGYKSETGGIMANLRESTSHKKVCDYHRAFYRPENLCIIIVGQVEPSQVFNALQPVEQKIIQKGPRSQFTRPWQSVVPPLSENKLLTVPYAADEETHGMMYMAWRGPLANDQFTFQAVGLLGEYLTDTAISPLQASLVEIDNPFCSQIHFGLIENSETCIYLIFKNADCEQLDNLPEKIKNVLNKVVSEPMDMERMAAVIQRKKLEVIDKVEEDPHDFIPFIIIGDFLYGNNEEDLKSRTHMIPQYLEMKSKPESFWKELIQKYFLNNNCAVIIGKPSVTLMESMGREEKERIEKQKEKYGPEGLKELEVTLEKATEANEKEAPCEMLTSVPVPNVSSIHFHNITPSSNFGSSDAKQKFPLPDLPLRILLDDMQTSFVNMNAIFDTSSVPNHLRCYLPLFSEIICELPVQKNEVLIPHDEVIKQLAADTLEHGGYLGLWGSNFACGLFPQLFTLMIKVEADNYTKGVEWLHHLLFSTMFTKDRVKIIAQKLLSNITSMKRKGQKVVSTALRDITYKKDCNVVAASMLRQEKFLAQVLKQLEDNDRDIIHDLEQLRKNIMNPKGLTIHMSANVSNLDSPESPWKHFLPTSIEESKMSQVMKKTCEYICDVSSLPHRQVIVGVGSVESAYLMKNVPCIQSCTHEDYPAIMVFIQYVTQCEGPMWRQIRGLGLSYHYSIYLDTDTGLLSFLLARSSQLADAYREGKSIVMGYANGTTDFTETEFESARSSLIFEIIEREKTKADVSKLSLLSHFRGLNLNFNKELLQKIAEVSMADLKRVGPTYVAPLFAQEGTRMAVCCNPSKIDDIVKEFSEMSETLMVIDSLENEIFR